MAVNARVLASAAGASNSVNSGGSPTQWSYPITYTPAPNNGSMVAGSCMTDSGAAAADATETRNIQAIATDGEILLVNDQGFGTARVSN